MDTHTQTFAPQDQDQAQAQEPLVYIPNIRPEGIEVAGDRNWRDWRLRKRRPEIRERYPATFPNVNALLDREAKALLNAQDDVDVVPFVKRTLKDLRNNSDYTVERLQFRPLQATQDRVDAIWAATRPRKPRPQDELDSLPAFFFESMSSDLFARVWDFAAETFGQQNAGDARSDAQKQADFEYRFQATDWTGQFLQYLPSEFVRCVSEIARGDHRNRGWKDYDPHGYEFLFLDRNQRVHLCTAVIAKLLQEHCFESLLFGARKKERDALKKTDEAQENIADGFARKMSRAASIPKYLTRDLFTVDFWPEVDRVTMGILELMLPMINFVGELEPSVPVLPLTQVHQQLHKIVAEAGWLANGLNMTRSCFWIEFPQPGQLWDLRQEHVIDVGWKASKAFADENDADNLRTAMRRWKQARLLVYDTLNDDPKPALEVWSKSTYELDNSRPRQVRRTAKVQISMWPFFERAYPYRQDLVSGGFNSGESTTVLQKAQVVYYAGDDTDAGEQQEDYTLKQYLEDYKRRNAILWGPRAWISWPLLLLLLSLALYFAGPSIRAGYDEVRYSHSNLSEQVISSWRWSTWEWPSRGWPRATDGAQPPEHRPLAGSPSRSPTTTTHSGTPKDKSFHFSRSSDSTSSSKRRPKPPVFTSEVYSTRVYTKTTRWTTTRSPGNQVHQNLDGRQRSTTTIPSDWTSTGKPIQDTPSATVIPTTTGAPEPTEQLSPVPTPSGPSDVSSTDRKTITERPTPGNSAPPEGSFWKWLWSFCRGVDAKAAVDEDPTVPQEGKTGESGSTGPNSDGGRKLVPTGIVEGDY